MEQGVPRRARHLIVLLKRSPYAARSPEGYDLTAYQQLSRGIRSTYRRGLPRDTIGPRNPNQSKTDELSKMRVRNQTCGDIMEKTKTRAFPTETGNWERLNFLFGDTTAPTETTHAPRRLRGESPRRRRGTCVPHGGLKKNMVVRLHSRSRHKQNTDSSTVSFTTNIVYSCLCNAITRPDLPKDTIRPPTNRKTPESKPLEQP